jgi:hypothetical protein
VPAELPIAAPFSKTVCCVTEQLDAAVDAVQLRVVLLLVVPDAVRFVGAFGGVAQAEQLPVDVHGWPLPAGPLFVEGFWFSVQKLFT